MINKGEKTKSCFTNLSSFSWLFLCAEGKCLFGGTNNSQTSETCQGTPTTSGFVVRGHKPKLICLHQYIFNLTGDFVSNTHINLTVNYSCRRTRSVTWHKMEMQFWGTFLKRSTSVNVVRYFPPLAFVRAHSNRMKVLLNKQVFILGESKHLTRRKAIQCFN